MKTFRIINILVVAALLFAMLPAQPATAQSVRQEIDPQAAYVPGEVVVTFAGGVSARAYAALAGAMADDMSAQVVGQSGSTVLLSFDPGADVAAMAQQIGSTPGVLFAQPNYVYNLTDGIGTPVPAGDAYSVQTTSGRTVSLSWNDLLSMRSKTTKGTRLLAAAAPTFPFEMPNTWGWRQVKADMIFANVTASPQVCLLDTGADKDHPDLKGKVILGYDFFNNDTISADDNGHGTFLAGIISALANKNTGSTVGVSNGTVLAIKVMGAQGNGTSYALAAGVRKCADTAAVRVINISAGLGDNKDLIVYNALKYAIVTKAKFVVAAAGNDSSSGMIFPAAWADAGAPVPVGVLVPNELSNGLVAVGAAASPDKVFAVDVNGDGSLDPDERFTNCAAFYAAPDGSGQPNGGSNYGNWVEVVAPGDDIYSTTPVTYPFWWRTALGVPAGYATMQGTSMAAAYVSASVARMLSVKTTLKANIAPLIKDELIGQSTPLSELNALAADGNLGLDPTIGYNNAGYGPNGDEFDPLIVAPYCWPTTNGEFDTPQDMGGAVYLNVAKMMGRGGVFMEVMDAVSGAPLAGAAVKALVGTAIKGTATIAVNAGDLVFIPNLPAGTYKVAVNKAGYTVGDAVVSDPAGIDVVAGEYYTDAYSSVGVPPTGNNAVVANWVNVPYDINGDGSDEPTTDLDLMVFTPSTATGIAKGVVNQGGLFYDPPEGVYGDPETAYNPPAYTGAFFTSAVNIGQGTLLAPSSWGGVGITSPYTQHMRESAADGIPMETVLLRLPVTPGMTGGAYTVVLTDYSGDYTGSGLSKEELVQAGYVGGRPSAFDPAEATFASPVVRIWVGGKLAANGYITANCAVGNDGWKAATITYLAGTVTATNACGVMNNATFTPYH